jgi:hypothetical protein
MSSSETALSDCDNEHVLPKKRKKGVVNDHILTIWCRKGTSATQTNSNFSHWINEMFRFKTPKYVLV